MGFTAFRTWCACRARRIEAQSGSCYHRSMSGKAIRIIGIDPGLRRTGWGVIDFDGVRLVYVACGSVVSDDAESLGRRLRQLFDGLSEVLARLSPLEAAIEQTFVNRDGSATLKLGQARGIAMLAPALARALNRRIRAEHGEEDGGRRRSRRQGPDQGDGEMPAAARGARQRRCRRRARHRHHPCPFAELGGGSKRGSRARERALP